MARKKAALTATLPATPCSPEMRERVVKISESASLSIAETQRMALALFLAIVDSSTHTSVSQTHKEQA